MLLSFAKCVICLSLFCLANSHSSIKTQFGCPHFWKTFSDTTFPCLFHLQSLNSCFLLECLLHLNSGVSIWKQDSSRYKVLKFCINCGFSQYSFILNVVHEFTTMEVKKERKESEVIQSCPTLWDPVDCSLPGFSVHGILEWVTISFSRGSSRPRDWTQSSALEADTLTSEPPGMWDECNCAVVWTFFGISLLWDWNENWLFAVLLPANLENSSLATTRKGQFSFQSQRREMPKNVQTTTQLLSSYMLAK